MIHIKTDRYVRPSLFATECLQSDHPECYDEYVKLRVRGIREGRAFIMAFSEAFEINQSEAPTTAMFVECAMAKRIVAAIEAADVAELWTPERAARLLAEIANDDRAPSRERLEAAKELKAVMPLAIAVKKAGVL